MDISDKECKQHLLHQQPSEDGDGHDEQLDHMMQGPFRLAQWRGNVASIVIVLLLSYIAILETITVATGLPRKTTGGLKDIKPSLIPPGTLEYEERMEWSPFVHPWTMPPSPELDNLWEDLLFASNVRVTKEEMEQLGANLTDRIQVDGGDYAAITGVIHHLHCLNTIRKVVHWDYYGPIVAPDNNIPEMLTKAHADHCIDAIRQTLMCRANTDLYTAEWLNDKHHPINMDMKATNTATCLKWDTLDNWARKRALVSGHYHFLPGPYPANVVTE